MATNKKFRIQNGANIQGELSFGNVTVIDSDGKVLVSAIEGSVGSIVDQSFVESLNITSADAIKSQKVDQISDFSTTDLSEGSNQYFTPTRARAAVQGGVGVSYDEGFGQFSIDLKTDPESGLSVSGDTISLDHSAVIGDLSAFVGDDVALSTTASTVTGAVNELVNEIALKEAASQNRDQVIEATATDLQNQINGILSNTSTSALDSLTEIVNAFQNADNDLMNTLMTIQTEVSSHDSRIGDLENWTTDDITEGLNNKYYTDARVFNYLSGGVCIKVDPDGTVSVDEADARANLVVAAADQSSNLGGQPPSHYRIDVYDINGSVVN